jgi:hypothetical protein
MSIDEFVSAVVTATPGDRIQYHCGFLAEDRRFPNPDHSTVNAVGDLAWAVGAPKGYKLPGEKGPVDASGLGVGALLQQRFGAGNYVYSIYIRRPVTVTEARLIKALAAKAKKRIEASSELLAA